MRNWYEPHEENNPKDDKASVRVSMDRRAIFTGAALLLGMALLLTVGLTPRRAAAPDEPNAAQAGVQTDALLAADCQIIQHLTYTPCGHELTRRQTLPPELAGQGREALEAAYDLWQVTSFSPTEVVMAQALDMYCPEHLVLMPDESGMLCVFENRYGDALALVNALNIPLSELPDDAQETLRTGLGFDSEEALNLWLESQES